MAYSSQAFISTFFFVLLVSLALQTVAGRNIPTDSKFQDFDGTVLIPGIGRVMLPKKGQHPLHYNPVTGAPNGDGVPIPGVGDLTGGAGGRTSIPGGDDTTLPNPVGIDLLPPPSP